MMTFELTRDMAAVRAVITHPKIWANVIDDFSPAREDFQPIDSDFILYVLPKEDERILGVVAFEMRSHIVFEMHPVLLPETWWQWGKAKEATLGAMNWIWENTQAERIIGCVPLLKHRTKLRFPPKLGMTQYGVHPKSFLKGGVLVDQVLFGVSRPDKIELMV
jgi:RimJ/RimL family protein N-acetyltransferase